MEKGDELFKAAVKRRMFLDMRSTSWDNVVKMMERESQEGNKKCVMSMSDICASQDDEEVQNIILWISEHMSKRGITINIGINEVEFNW